MHRFRRHALPLLGIGYLLVITLLVTLSVQIFRKQMPWQETVAVSLSTPTPGLELHPQSDVKLQGMRVGEVREITSDGAMATIHLALDPGAIGLIPRNVDAAIIPKTLFGEKYVDLLPPKRPAGPIRAGDVIGQSTTSVEIGELFTNLHGLLRTLKPEKVSLALNSLADALQGRGEQLGQTLELLNTYFDGFNPHLETFTRDIELFAETADLYAESAPQLLRTLANSAATSRELLVPKQRSFAAFLDQSIRGAAKTTDVLARNAETLIRLSGRSRPVLDLLAEYSRSFPCTIHAFHVGDIASGQAAGAQGPFTTLSIDVITHREPYRYPRDLPSHPGSDANNANLPAIVPNWDPHCPYIAERFRDLTDPEPNSQHLPGQNPTTPGRDRGGDSSAGAARQGLATTIAGRLLGVPAADAPPVATLLVTPMLADGEVQV